MRTFILAAGLAGALAVLHSPSAAAASASSTVSIDLAAFTSALETGGVDFTGWFYESGSGVVSGADSAGQHSYGPDSSASLPGRATAASTAGMVSATSDGHSTANASVLFKAGVTVGGGEHFRFAIPYAIVMHREQVAEVIDASIYFITSANAVPYSVGRQTGTRDWREPLGTQAEVSYLNFDLFNSGTHAATYVLSGSLGTSIDILSNPVPEPEQAVLWLAGCTLLIAALKKRKMLVC